jgi:hypothetical protein
MRGATFVVLLLGLLPEAWSIYFHVTSGAQRCFIEEMPGQTLFLATYKNPDFKPWGEEGFTDTAVMIRVLDPIGGTVLSRVADVSGKVAFHSTAGGEYQLCFSTNSSKWIDGTPQKFVRCGACRKYAWALPRWLCVCVCLVCVEIPSLGAYSLCCRSVTLHPPPPRLPPDTCTHPPSPKNNLFSWTQRVDLKLDVGEGGLDYAEVAKKEHLSELEVEIRKLNDKVKDVLAEQTYQRQRELEFRKTSEDIHSKQQYWSLFQITVMVAASYIQVTTLLNFFKHKKSA